MINDTFNWVKCIVDHHVLYGEPTIFPITFSYHKLDVSPCFLRHLCSNLAICQTQHFTFMLFDICCWNWFTICKHLLLDNKKHCSVSQCQEQLLYPICHGARYKWFITYITIFKWAHWDKRVENEICAYFVLISHY